MGSACRPPSPFPDCRTASPPPPTHWWRWRTQLLVRERYGGRGGGREGEGEGKMEEGGRDVSGNGGCSYR